MIFNEQDQNFLRRIAPTKTGRQLVDVLKNIVLFHADIRNVNDVPPEVRIDSLKFFQESLIDKLELFAKEDKEPPMEDEYR